MALMKVNNKSFSKAEFKAVIGVQNPAAAEALLPHQKKRKNNLWQEITEAVNSHYILSENRAKS